MDELENMIRRGKAIGLEGAALRQFVCDERLAQCERRRERMKEEDDRRRERMKEDDRRRERMKEEDDRRRERMKEEERRLRDEDEQDKVRSALRLRAMQQELEALRARGEPSRSDGSVAASKEGEVTGEMAGKALEDAGERDDQCSDRKAEAEVALAADKVLLAPPPEPGELTFEASEICNVKGRRGERYGVLGVGVSAKTLEANKLKEQFSRVQEQPDVTMVATVTPDGENGALRCALREPADHGDAAVPERKSATSD